MFYTLIRKLFTKQIINDSELGFRAGERLQYEATAKSRRDIALFVLEEMVGKPIISVCNEWDDPVVGFATEIQYIGDSPLLVGKDYVTGKEVLMFSKTFGYTEQRFAAFMKLDPFERACLIYDCDAITPFDKYKRETVHTEAEIVAMLTANGFYEELAKFRKTKACA